MTEITAADAVPAKRGKDKTILLTGLIIYGLGQTLLYIIFGPLAREVGLSETQFGILVSASNVALIFSSPRWGRASDTLGRRTVFVLGLIGFAAGYAGLAFGVQAGLWAWIAVTPLFFVLLGARLIYGIFAGGIQPAAQAYIADTTDAGSRAQGMALVAASGGIGTIIGPVFGGLLAEISPLFPMYAAAGLALGAALWAWFGLTEPKRHVSIEPQARLRFTDSRIFPYLLGWFVIFMVFTGIQVVTAFFVKDQIGLDGQQAVIRATSIAMFCMAIVTVIVQVGVLQYWKLPPKLLLRTSFILFGLVLLLLAQVQTLPMLFVTFALMGLGASLAMPSLSAAASIAVEPHEQGAAAGLLTAAPTLGMVFGPALGAMLYQQGVALPMLAGGAVTILTGIYFWFVRIPDSPAAD